MKWHKGFSGDERGEMGAGCLMVGIVCIAVILMILGAVDVALEPVERALSDSLIGVSY